MNKFKDFWKKNGAALLVFSIIPAAFINHYIYGIIIALFLTVPCGSKKVNTTPWLWNLRQLYFGLLAFIAIFILK